MPDNKGVGWRKKSKPKELQPLKLGLDHLVGADDASDRRRHHGWRKTIQGSRPATPATAPPVTPTVEETEDALSERTEPTTPRRDSKPKLVRYTSLFSSFASTPKGPEFSEPWGEEPLLFEPYADPKLAIASIRAHMASFSMKPIPPEHNNNLFRIFEDYHKRRDEIDRLQIALKELSERQLQYETGWADYERQYAEEIRRLELLIAQGVTGVAGVLNARQSSVLDRKRMHRKTISNSKTRTHHEFLTQEQIDTEIRLRSQRVLLQRSTSPSTKMTALSRHFTGRAGEDLRIGTPPDDINPMLSRKVQSEMNLAKLGHVDTASSVEHSSVISGFSGTGDHLPDEMSSPISAMVEVAVDCDAIIALRELGTLVARRRGLETAEFIEGLMQLLSQPCVPNKRTDEEFGVSDTIPVRDGPGTKNTAIDDTTPQRTLRKFQSQPQLTSEKRRRRHFSFEPGEDQLLALNEEMRENDASRYYDVSMKSSGPQLLSHPHESNADPSPEVSIPWQSATQQDSHNASKIPSPVQVYGSVRREESISSLQSATAKSADSRHNSLSSVLTAFRDNHNVNLRPSSSSRSSSFNTQRSAEMSPSSRDRPVSTRAPSGVSILSADHQRPVSQGGNPARTIRPSKTSSLRASRTMGPLTQENDEPDQSG
ncbi:hypothetical protein HBI17_125340 [Parastagonospora nodorum]|nr:hypothetical protein HBI06_162520 [Parastagonospora nodorum]KAH4247751.1 hypothetical protein HBI05_031570 [Parastagonospora nodorum]KAH5747929.1 hypothetical protein HBI17_125340 [Parastagonospora nodorum]